MKVKFIVDEGKYKTNHVYELDEDVALRFLQKGKAKVYVPKPEKAIIR